ncbi:MULTISPECIES: dihydroxyacetone kinase subunit DhaK [Streptomyces]|uniref:Dihydroxyacetone kinase subunit DhaK n=1 Tax=Streptomyces evansiae TaxID=3075535 RepID=A0ABU2R488_9ACTN|nr:MULTISPECIES: dihydroxyacetone kinase subunit DhaK [unclassified Streptomyces]EFL03182.1 dihydroxyacetone kinase, DhaK subunit [Streptomyces sp. SPB78]MDT0410884.1 dihydroxyacetone kinase subunit DhaK [Streptomyces sp. DSM 41979]MDT0420212.1 dihydroxyacetone kinase subunit DhaK [Streptomyces sp. DSM 41859]MYQ58022.1 dihydroxyacetone kinase [Streptomyces sp. SID4926]MYR28190.1 dihydroxyacetone kinase [Streptomyces sp. SID4945]
MAPYFENNGDRLVPDALRGFARAHGDLLSLDPEHGFLLARDTAPGRRVGLLSGGGAGHEPLHAGFVGPGMLDVAVPGRVFASPHNRQVYAASRAGARADGVLHLVKNYTGDRINFGIAAERLAHDGIACARVLIDDDLASDAEEIASGRRGTGGTVLVEKVLGAAADEGLGLDELAAVGAGLAARCRSLAVASAAHTAPTTGERAFELADGELEYGVGIHGERAGRTIPRGELTPLVERMTGELLAALDPGTGSEAIVLVNGLGAVTPLELYGIYGEVARHLEAQGVRPARSLVGNYVTALDMRGFSVSLLLADEETLRRWDAPVRTAALRW